MALNIRRVITGHDAQGKAKVLFDEVMTSPQNNRPGADFYNIWSTEGFPVNNDRSDDTSKRPLKTALPGGIVFRIVSFGPGVAPRNHRTDTIDFAVVISGAIEMELDIGSVTLKAGDVLVQRGTIHNWVNKGTEPCVIAFTLVDAKPVEAGGQILPAHG